MSVVVLRRLRPGVRQRSAWVRSPSYCSLPIFNPLSASADMLPLIIPWPPFYSVRYGVTLASESSNIDHMTPSPRLRACLSTAPYRTPHAYAFPFCLARLLLPTSSRHPPHALAACYPRSSLDQHLPLRSQAVLPIAPQNHRSRLKRCPRRIGRHQKRKTLLLFVARIAHRPWPSPLKVWTLSRFRRIAAGYGIAQDIRMLLLFPFCFRCSALHSLAFPICLRPCYRARHLISHPPTSAQSSPLSRPTFSKVLRVRTSHTTPRSLLLAASISSS